MNQHPCLLNNSFNFSFLCHSTLLPYCGFQLASGALITMVIEYYYVSWVKAHTTNKWNFEDVIGRVCALCVCPFNFVMGYYSIISLTLCVFLWTPSYIYFKLITQTVNSDFQCDFGYSKISGMDSVLYNMFHTRTSFE